MELQLILPLALVVALVGILYMHHRERSEMLDRLMAKSLPEYKDNADAPEPNQLTDKDDGTVPIDQAEAELMQEDDGEEE